MEQSRRGGNRVSCCGIKSGPERDRTADPLVANHVTGSTLPDKLPEIPRKRRQPALLVTGTEASYHPETGSTIRSSAARDDLPVVQVGRVSPNLELIVDSFAGGGGASFGIELATGRSPDIAINHDREAIALHAANHPESVHYTEDVWQVDPRVACAGRPVGLMWLSPDCKHFSKAKGGKPVSKRVRGLAWVAVRWAKAVRPRVIVLENVEEFQSWGPLGDDGRPEEQAA